MFVEPTYLCTVYSRNASSQKEPDAYRIATAYRTTTCDPLMIALAESPLAKMSVRPRSSVRVQKRPRSERFCALLTTLGMVPPGRGAAEVLQSETGVEVKNSSRYPTLPLL